jgi:hypothetical protein
VTKLRRSSRVGSLKFARPGADAAAAIALYEVNRPSITVVLEVEQDAGHDDNIDRLGLRLRYFSFGSPGHLYK